MSKLQEVTDATFQAEVLDSKVPVLVDFTASWCGPCRTMKPVLALLAEDYKASHKVVVLDTETSQDTATRYGVMSLPTLLLFKRSKVVGQLTGVQGRSKLDHFLSFIK